MNCQLSAGTSKHAPEKWCNDWNNYWRRVSLQNHSPTQLPNQTHVMRLRWFSKSTRGSCVSHCVMCAMRESPDSCKAMLPTIGSSVCYKQQASLAAVWGDFNRKYFSGFRQQIFWHVVNGLWQAVVSNCRNSHFSKARHPYNVLPNGSSKTPKDARSAAQHHHKSQKFELRGARIAIRAFGFLLMIITISTPRTSTGPVTEKPTKDPGAIFCCVRSHRQLNAICDWVRACSRSNTSKHFSMPSRWYYQWYGIKTKNG